MVYEHLWVTTQGISSKKILAHKVRQVIELD